MPPLYEYKCQNKDCRARHQERCALGAANVKVIFRPCRKDEANGLCAYGRVLSPTPTNFKFADRTSIK